MYVGVLGVFLLLDGALDLVAVDECHELAHRGLFLELELVDRCIPPTPPHTASVDDDECSCLHHDRKESSGEQA